LYNGVKKSDIPFAQDQLGDQFFIRKSSVIRLCAESGNIESIAGSLHEFLEKVDCDIEAYLNVGLSKKMEPGQLLFAYPPLICRESGTGASLRPVPAHEAIHFHAELAKLIKDLPEGAKFRIEVSR